MSLERHTLKGVSDARLTGRSVPMLRRSESSGLPQGGLPRASSGLGLADLLRAEAAGAARRAARRPRPLGDPGLARRRPAPARDLRPQARRPRRVPRPAQGDEHVRAGHPDLGAPALPRADDGQDVDHPLDAPQHRRPLRRRPLDADRATTARTPSTSPPQYPSAGSIIAKLKGAKAPGMPAYVGLPNTHSVGLVPGYHGGAYLGVAYNPFSADGDPNTRRLPGPEPGAARRGRPAAVRRPPRPARAPSTAPAATWTPRA